MTERLREAVEKAAEVLEPEEQEQLASNVMFRCVRDSERRRLSDKEKGLARFTCVDDEPHHVANDLRPSRTWLFGSKIADAIRSLRSHPQ